jgi:hexosaminidase
MQPSISSSSVLPEVSNYSRWGGTFTLFPTTKIHIQGVDESAVSYIIETLRASTGWALPVLHTTEGISKEEHAIVFELNKEWEFQQDAYFLSINPNVVYIHASSPAGLFYGGISFLQQLPIVVFEKRVRHGITWSAPCGGCGDNPRYTWRGAMLDVGRYFFPVPVIKRYLEQMAILKLNKFHWHLTEDQGWRIEIKKYPKLTEVGAWRKESPTGHVSFPNVRGNGIPHGGFYTQDEIREVVAYAAKLHIEVVPEIDMPGHMVAAIASYPELGCREQPTEVETKWGVNSDVLYPGPETVKFMQDVLEEVLELFPCKYIHIGGDEVPKTLWNTTPKVIELREKLGLKDSHELQSWFIRQMDDFLTARGRRLVGWDEILEGGLAKGAVVMAWRNFTGGKEAAKLGHDVIIAVNGWTYFDYGYDNDHSKEPLVIGGCLSLKKTYEFNPQPEDVFGENEAKHVLGLQGQLWTEYIDTEFRLQYQSFPRLCALAEVAWCQPEKRDWDAFLQRLKTHLRRLSIMQVVYRPLDY